MVCKKQEQCKFGKMCGWAKDEETLLTECVEFIERVPLTNEEWFDSLTTEEKAKVFANATYSTAETPLTILWGGKEAEQKKWELWLKQPHTPIS